MAILRNRFMEALKQRIGEHALPIRIIFWDGQECRFSEQPQITLRLHSPQALQQLLLGSGLDELGEAYVEGEIEVDGRFQDILRFGSEFARILESGRRVSMVSSLFDRFGGRHSKARDAKAIRYHYDVSNEFYSLWLDHHMVYSCAYFKTGVEDIHTAQEQKLDHICRKLRLQPGERMLDIGCGWGGLLIWAAKHYGIHGVGVTLSKQQYIFARERVATEGLTGQIEIRLQDYRDIPGEDLYDKIASIGMFEHVGLTQLPVYFTTIRRLLKEGGWVLNHGITTAQRNDKALAGSGFINKYVFPDGELPHIWRVLHEMAGQQLETLDVENLRPHYAQTLIHWVRRLKENKTRALALVGPKRYRIWSIYMAGCAHAFEQGRIAIYQVLAAKQTQAGLTPRPWERRYLYQPEHPAPTAYVHWDDL